MSEEHDGRVSSGLRGWLSEVYFPALVEGSLGPLSARLGPRATLDDPLVGHSAGPEVEAKITEASRWLRERHASYSREILVVGPDRDVTEGTLTLGLEGKTILLPVAVVVERRKEREVALRIYYATRPLRVEAPPRAALVPREEELSLPRMVGEHLAALRTGNLDALLGCFETEGIVRDEAGIEHRNAGGGLRVYYQQRFGVGQVGGGGLRVPGGCADDGRCCAVEFTLTRVRDEMVSERPGLAVYELGDSGLLRSIRLYQELEV